MLNTLKMCLPSTTSDVSGICTSMITVCAEEEEVEEEGECVCVEEEGRGECAW